MIIIILLMIITMIITYYYYYWQGLHNHVSMLSLTISYSINVLYQLLLTTISLLSFTMSYTSCSCIDAIIHMFLLLLWLSYYSVNILVLLLLLLLYYNYVLLLLLWLSFMCYSYYYSNYYGYHILRPGQEFKAGRLRRRGLRICYTQT